MTTYLNQNPDSNVTFEDMITYALSIGCRLERDGIVCTTEEQHRLLREWTEKEFSKATIQ